MPQPERTARFTFRMRPRERELIDTAAEKLGVYPSELVRAASVRAARRELDRLRSKVRAETGDGHG